VERLRPRVQQIADELIDGFASTGEAEIMAAFAIPLTVRAIAGIVGVEEARVDDFWSWGNAIVAAFGGDAAAAGAGLVALQELFAYLQTTIEAIRAAGPPGDGVLAGLVWAEDDAGDDRVRLDDEEIKLATMQLITAGFETTSTATASAIHLLCTHPEERAKLAATPALIGSTVEEVLRFASPLEGLFRTTTADATVAGTTIPAGAKVRIVYASANRDDRRFDDPDTFRIDRDPEELRGHLAFGQGTHYCIGAALARLELTCALATLLRRLPTLELHPSRPAERAAALVINGFRTLPVRWDPTSVVPA
jgi:cytochrome P450